MNKARFSGSIAAVTMLSLFAPMAMAATADDAVTKEELLPELTEEDMLLDMPAVDGRGGGAMSSIMYPYPGQGGVSVDASITKEVTPDFVALNAWCTVDTSGTREQVRVSLDQLYNKIKNAVGTNGRVRKAGGYSIMPMYDQVGKETGSYNGNLSVFIRFTNVKATQDVATLLENEGCSPSWDVRLLDTQSYETNLIDELLVRLNKRKTLFEKLLGKKLTDVSGASMNTWVDGYTSYDPEANTADAQTTLSVTFAVSPTKLPAASSSSAQSRAAARKAATMKAVTPAK